ncbi:hypothetical protein AN697_12950 [Enterobacter cloacae subsp. cloacae]|uniref:ead/Ea22-like family protein n=1 Tax=Enterobacter cloacae TaxID=550 RepID=UPI0006DBA789|nr:ead/Ea22-like family protein [Enterobacter cloacae]KPU04456.1 hypothetical protein AN697_12950 [Enterobacter cloacae subsp. cloacae]
MTLKKLTQAEKNKIRRKAIEAITDENYGDDGDNFHEHATAQAVISLLDELELKTEQRANWCTMAKKLGEDLDAVERRIAELEARRVPDSFNIIGENIRTQDNRITSEPMFCVFQKREIVVDEDYDCDRIVWVDEEGCEATERQRMRLELLHDNCRETPDKWRRIAVKDIDDFVTCCFTEQGCKDYLACNGHNLRLPFIYVKSGFRNDEYIGIRNWLAGIGKGECPLGFNRSISNGESS